MNSIFKCSLDLDYDISQKRVSATYSEGCTEKINSKGNMHPITKCVERLQKDCVAKPIVKWAGGKRQILEEIQKRYPVELGKTLKKYAEPFIGGGAVLLDLLSSYKFEKVYFSDTNKELVNVYSVVRDQPELLVDLLKKIQLEYIPLDDDKRKEYYYSKRDEFNKIKMSDYMIASAEMASLFIFLNKTCFNGLYRVNSKGLFNVPIGRYKNPTICDEGNILNVSSLLENTEIVHGDYRKSVDFIDGSTFVYFDPPYRPITETSAFTSYTNNSFDDGDQKELADYAKLLSRKGAKVMISNSDPKNTDPSDDFFDNLYRDFHINRIDAKRNINSKGGGRGTVSELLITNYLV